MKVSLSEHPSEEDEVVSDPSLRLIGSIAMPRTRAKKADAAAAAAEESSKSLTDDASAQPSTEDSAETERSSLPQEKSADEDRQEMEASASSSGAPKVTMEERALKMKELRKKMADSSMANRRAVASEASQHKRAVRPSAGAQRKLDKAEKTLDARDAQERGEDWERVKAWNYTIEDNDRWEEKLAAKEQTKDQGPQDINTASERQYRRLVSQMKTGAKGPDEHGTGKNARAGPSTASSSAVMLHPGQGGSGQGAQVMRKDDLYPDSSSLSYGTHKPDEAALDRVSSHLNAEADRRTKFSRKRPDDGDGDVTYINDKNKHYNKKIARYFDRYTQEIRDNFERGTAL